MRIDCPLCGARDHREFTFKSVALTRPAEDAPDAEWATYLHLRENVAGAQDEFWQHASGCGAWLVVRRDITTHAVQSTRLASEAG